MDRTREVPRGRGALLGLVTAGVAVGVGHLTAAVLATGSSPLVAVGQTAIDLAPPWLKSFAIATFGERDKVALLLGMAVVLAIGAALLGIWSIEHPRRAYVGLAALGAVGAVAALTRAGAGPAWALPSLVGAGAGTFAFSRLHAALEADPGPRDPSPAPAPEPSGTYDRRRFFRTAAGGIAVATVAGGLGTYLIRRTSAGESRAAVGVPDPESPAADVADAGVDVEGAQPFFTPNDRFYKVDTTFVTPSVMVEDWRLRIHGMLERPITLDYDDVLARPMIERDVTLTCVSNEVGGEYVGNARWIGTPLAPLLEEAGIDPAADQLVSRSVDGWTCGTPTAVVMDGRDAMLAVAMNGEPLPIAHGFPVRMIVPGLYGYVSATKWVVDIEATTFAAFDAYWITRGWAREGPIKTQSRIDTPRGGTSLAVGEVAVAGVAWAQHTGIERVEVQVDDGPWAEADLADEASIDTWRQWVYRWQATPGEHTLRVRATDRDGLTQPEARATPFPDGATGWHEIRVTAG